MKKSDDFLVEILTEELPSKALLPLSRAFSEQMSAQLEKANLSFDAILAFATPRRLALLVKNLIAQQPNQTIERKGPAKELAFDQQGVPSNACVGFARSLGILPSELITLKNEQGEWVGFRQEVKGQLATALLPTLVTQALSALPIAKRMRWGRGENQFIRPVHSLVLMYGDQVVDATLLGCPAGSETLGHRFYTKTPIIIKEASSYSSLLETEGYVIADFAKRRALIQEKTIQCVKEKTESTGHALISDELLDEVTGLVEWPVALCGQFDSSFLHLPEEVLIAAMQDHQRYFPVVNEENHLLPFFVIISNIQSENRERVIHGNERVLRARLSDAAFFYEVDQKEKVEVRLQHLKGMVYQNKLGTLYDKAKRLSQLTAVIAEKMGLRQEDAHRAGLLSKTDLTTQMVGEFPELQGVMGYYYAKQEGESLEVALAIKEQYLPRFAGDQLPHHSMGCALSVADRIDTLLGLFGISNFPTGDKDPYGLRRAALGLLRILIENKINLDLQEVIEHAFSFYQQKLENTQTISQVIIFIKERWRSFCLEKGISADVFASVAALEMFNPWDGERRMFAVQAFKKQEVAVLLAIANKRVHHILTQYQAPLRAQTVNPAFFEHAAEKKLAHQLEVKNQVIQHLYQTRQYDEVLAQLTELSQPIDDFFDQVMVMVEDQSRRENRILLLSQLRTLFLQVADITHLQYKDLK